MSRCADRFFPGLRDAVDVVPEDGFTMSDDGTPMPCASYTKGPRERGEDSKASRPEPGLSAGIGIPRGPQKSTGRLASGPNEPFFVFLH